MNFESLLTYQNVIGKEPRTIFFNAIETNFLQEERILVTGAGGSIGSRVVSLLDSIGGVTYLATDRDESALHSLSLELRNTALFDSGDFMLMDIRDKKSIEDLYNFFDPTVVIHAAALKHLSVLERQPREALLTNVFGTASLLECAAGTRIRTFVNISTDKAANPVSVLGRSKKAAEIYTAYNRRVAGLLSTSCRFGNVFASRGSVIETFASQMIKNEPITLTQDDISRFFMHVDEAAFLSIKSLLIDGGDVHVFDMGEPVLMKYVIKQMRHVLSSTSPVLITGLRPGEKVEEELFDLRENPIPTSDPSIASTNLGFSDKEIYDFSETIEIRDEVRLLDYLISGVFPN
jgi:FlaA1/EpsC-like NDP-sugar epimerase